MTDTKGPDLKGKKVAMIIASKNFRDEEFEEPYNLLKQSGAEVAIASSSKEKSKGMLGKVVAPDKLVVDVKADEYDCILFVGGSGASEYFENAAAHAIAKAAVEKGKLLCAICIAPATLANAGVLKGRKATCFPSVASVLTKGGASYTKQPVVRDGLIVTASGPEAAKEFAKTVADALAGK